MDTSHKIPASWAALKRISALAKDGPIFAPAEYNPGVLEIPFSILRSIGSWRDDLVSDHYLPAMPNFIRFWNFLAVFNILLLGFTGCQFNQTSNESLRWFDFLYCDYEIEQFRKKTYPWSAPWEAAPFVPSCKRPVEATVTPFNCTTIIAASRLFFPYACIEKRLNTTMGPFYCAHKIRGKFPPLLSGNFEALHTLFPEYRFKCEALDHRASRVAMFCYVHTHIVRDGQVFPWIPELAPELQNLFPPEFHETIPAVAAKIFTETPELSLPSSAYSVMDDYYSVLRRANPSLLQLYDDVVDEQVRTKVLPTLLENEVITMDTAKQYKREADTYLSLYMELLRLW